MTDLADAPSTPQPAAPTKNTLQRIAGVLFAPAETFEDIARKPNILGPLLIIVLLGYVSTFFIVQRMDWNAVMEAQMDAMKKQNPNMSQQDFDRVAKVSSAMGKVIGWISPLMGVVWYVILAGVLLLAFRMTGGEGNFQQALSTTLYAWMPLLINGIILTIVIIARGSVDPTQMATVLKSNPAFLVDMKEHAVLFSLLSTFDIFTIWTIILLIIGFAAVSKSSKAKSAAIVISLWVVFILIKIGFAAIGAARMKA